MKKYKDVFEGMIAELNKTSKDPNFLADAKIMWGKSDERNKNNRIYLQRPLKKGSSYMAKKHVAFAPASQKQNKWAE